MAEGGREGDSFVRAVACSDNSYVYVETLREYSDASANEDNSFRNHIR